MPTAPSYRTDINATYQAVVADYERQRSTAGILLNKAKDRRYRPDLRLLISNLVLMNAASIAEEAIRELLVTHLDLMNEKIRYSFYIPDAVKERAVKALSHSLGKSDGMDWSNQRHLHSVLEMMESRLSRPAFLPEEMSKNEANFTSSFTTSYFKAVGIAKIWEKIAKYYVQTNPGLYSAPDVCMTAIVGRWNDVIIERNRIVHRLTSGSGWGPEKVQEESDFSAKIISCLSDALCEQTSDIVATYYRKVRRGEHRI